MRAWVVMIAVLLAACGTDERSAPGDGQQSFAIALPDGRDVRLPVDVTTYLLLTAVGNGGNAVVYGAENLPTWAILSGDFLAFSPSTADAGTYDITITAWAGAAADSKQLRLLVEVPNHPPELPYGWVSDAINPNAMFRAGSPCMLDPIVRVTSRDPDGDRLRLEIEAVPHGTEFTRMPTLTVDGPRPGGYDGTYSQFEVAIPGLLPSTPYDVAVRTVDTFGASSPWRPFVEGLACIPIGLTAPYMGDLYSGETKSYEIGLQGVTAAGWTLTASGLPSFAVLDGTTLTVAAPVVTAPRSYDVVLTLQSGSYTYVLQRTILVRP